MALKGWLPPQGHPVNRVKLGLFQVLFPLLQGVCDQDPSPPQPRRPTHPSLGAPGRESRFSERVLLCVQRLVPTCLGPGCPSHDPYLTVTCPPFPLPLVCPGSTGSETPQEELRERLSVVHSSLFTQHCRKLKPICLRE